MNEMNLESSGFKSDFAFTQFIGVHENQLFVAKHSEDLIEIYCKEVINNGDWKLFWFCGSSQFSKSLCPNCCDPKIAVVYGICSKFIHIFYGIGGGSSGVFRLCKIDLKSGEEFELEFNLETVTFFVAHMKEICDVCRNSKLFCQTFDDGTSSSVTITHLNEYLSVMKFDVDWKNAVISEHKLKFCDMDDILIDDAFANSYRVSDVAINSDGVVALIVANTMILVHLEDHEFIETRRKCSELSNNGILPDYFKLYLYAIEKEFKCIIIQNWHEQKNFTIGFENEPPEFTLLPDKALPNIRSKPSCLELVQWNFLITDEYFFGANFKELYTFVRRIMSLTECSYLAFQKVRQVSVEKLKKKLGFPKFLPLTKIPALL